MIYSPDERSGPFTFNPVQRAVRRDASRDPSHIGCLSYRVEEADARRRKAESAPTSSCREILIPALARRGNTRGVCRVRKPLAVIKCSDEAGDSTNNKPLTILDLPTAMRYAALNFPDPERQLAHAVSARCRSGAGLGSNPFSHRERRRRRYLPSDPRSRSAAF